MKEIDNGAAGDPLFVKPRAREVQTMANKFTGSE